MPLFYNDDQTMLQETASQFMAEEGSIKNQLRHWRDRECKDGFGHALWKQMAEMGFTGLLVSEADGGLGMGHAEAGIVLIPLAVMSGIAVLSPRSIGPALRCLPSVRRRWPNATTDR
ncbi:acyl-CoA dehydrogenase family protein [Leptolyngbya sp. 15MV]|nr:acyl-CoA dehydrogenase family protein [Leptolyngbya sp. 15MV]